jgi:hypothetical protein
VLWHTIVETFPVEGGDWEMLWVDHWDDATPENVKAYPVLRMGRTLRGLIKPIAGPMTDPDHAMGGEWAVPAAKYCSSSFSCRNGLHR